MKKIYLYTSLVLLLAAGCTKELTQDPSNAVNTTDAFKTPNDFTNAIRGVYAALRGQSYYGGSDGNSTADANNTAGTGGMVATPDILADNLILNQQGRRTQQTYFNFKYVSNVTWTAWTDAYIVVLRANYVLANIDHLPAGDFKNNIQAEALGLRALAHFDLLRIYAKSYTSASENDPGVPYVTSVDANATPARTPDKKAYEMVVADLVQAEGLIADDNGEGRLDKAAIEGLLSRAYLYEGDWQNAADAATKAIADAPAANQLATTDEFGDIWTDDSDADVLFKVKILDDDDDIIGTAYKQATPDGVKPEYSVDFAFFNLFAANDVRKAAYIGQGLFNGLNFNYVKKYSGRTSGNADVVDFKVLRMGEVYLNRAEAYYNLGNVPGALEDLNTLRSHRYTGFVDGSESGTTLYNAILLQRRLELAFEGARFFDLKRLNLPIQRSSYGDVADGSGVPATVKTVPAGSYLFELPIPQSELDANPNMVQNTGY